MCDTFVVVDSDRVIFAKNSDREPNEAQVLSWIAARDHPPGAQLQCTWRTLPQVQRTHALILSRPYWMWGAEMGANEHGVVIGNEALFTRGTFAPDGLSGMDIVRLALERAASAVEAVELIGELVQTHGQGGRCTYGTSGFRYHNSFLVADRHQAWVVETVGRQVATERVTRGVRAISNALTIPRLSRYSRALHTRIAAARTRRARVQCLAREVRSAGAAADVLADHGPWPAPRFNILNGAMQAPCMHAGGLIAASQTVSSWISELGDQGASHWATGTSAPCLGVFRPLEFNRGRDCGRPTGSPDNSSLWWRFEHFHRRVMRNPHCLPPSYAIDRSRVQQAIFADPQGGWDIAEDWLGRWEGFAADTDTDTRPAWLRFYWRGVAAQANAGALLPWRDPSATAERPSAAS